jgi:hypothetical protein
MLNMKITFSEENNAPFSYLEIKMHFNTKYYFENISISAVLLIYFTVLKYFINKNIKSHEVEAKKKAPKKPVSCLFFFVSSLSPRNT